MIDLFLIDDECILGKRNYLIFGTKKALQRRALTFIGRLFYSIVTGSFVIRISRSPLMLRASTFKFLFFLILSMALSEETSLSW